MLNPEEKVKIRHHMGYPQVKAARTFFLGYPISAPTSTMIEGSLDQVEPQAEGQLRKLIVTLDAIEEQMTGDMELLAVEAIDEIKIRQDEFEQLLRQYKHWQLAMGNILGVPPNPFDQRFMGAGGGINAPVTGG